MKVTTKLCSIEQIYFTKNNGCSSPKMDDYLLRSNNGNEMKNDDNACKTL